MASCVGSRYYKTYWSCLQCKLYYHLHTVYIIYSILNLAHIHWHCESEYMLYMIYLLYVNYYPTFCILRAAVKNKHFLQIMFVWPRIRLTTTPDISVPQGWSVYTQLMLVSKLVSMSLCNTGRRFIDQDL